MVVRRVSRFHQDRRLRLDVSLYLFLCYNSYNPPGQIIFSKNEAAKLLITKGQVKRL